MGFIELSQFTDDNSEVPTTNGVAREDESRVRRTLEKSWPILGYLKNEKAEDLFAWIGDCIADVVEVGMKTFDQGLPAELPMGVTFSFPMMYDAVPPPCRV